MQLTPSLWPRSTRDASTVLVLWSNLHSFWRSVTSKLRHSLRTQLRVCCWSSSLSPHAMDTKALSAQHVQAYLQQKTSRHCRK